MDLELLKRFAVVVEEGSLTGAAEKLHTSQPAISRAMTLFEYRLKLTLLVRHRRGVELTADGERLYDFAKKIILEANTFEKALREKTDEIEGELKIMTTPHLGAEWLLPKLKKFIDDDEDSYVIKAWLNANGQLSKEILETIFEWIKLN